MASPKRLRVALFTESYLPVPNGVTTSVRALARELARLGHEPVIVAPRFPNYAGDTDDDLRVLRLPSWRTPLNPQNPFAYPPQFGTPAVLRDLACDIVHAHHPFGIGLHAQKTARRLGVPLVATFHTLYHEYGHYVPFLPTATVPTVVLPYLRRFYDACDAVVAPSEFAANVLHDRAKVRTPVTVVPTGVPKPADATKQAGDNRQTADEVSGAAQTLLYVGRMAREKNLSLLLRALTHLPQNVVLQMVGGGPHLEALQREASALGVAERMRWAGFVRHSDLAPIYRTATLFVFPSRSETQGIVLGEAQSFGLPVVCVRGGGASESVRDKVDSIVLPDDADAETFADAVRSLLTNDALRQLFANAAVTNPLRLSPADSARRILSVYQSVDQTVMI